MAATQQAAAAVCANCGHTLDGRFCSNCGEERLDFHNLTVRHFLTHSLHEIFELDGKIWRTLRALLFQPGLLSEEYCRGKRRFYVNPYRLVITAAIVFALATRGGLQVGMTAGPVDVSLAPASVNESASIAETVRKVDRFHLLGRLERPGVEESESERGKFHERMEKFAEPLSFANVFLLSLVLQALYGWRRKHFVENGVFSMHFMSFVLFTSSLLGPLSLLLRAGWGVVVLPVVLIIVFGQFLYLVLAIRRFYFGSRLRGLGSKLMVGFSVVAVYFLNSVFITGVQTLGAAIALWLAIPRA